MVGSGYMSLPACRTVQETNAKQVHQPLASIRPQHCVGDAQFAAVMMVHATSQPCSTLVHMPVSAVCQIHSCDSCCSTSVDLHKRLPIVPCSFGMHTTHAAGVAFPIAKGVYVFDSAVVFQDTKGGVQVKSRLLSVLSSTGSCHLLVSSQRV